MRAEECGDGVQRPLSPVEQGLLFHYFYETEGAYVDQMVCDLVGPLDVRRFEQALQRLVALHESLRTCYVRGPGLEMIGVVRSAPLPRIGVIDLSAEADARAIVSRRVAADAEARFDLSRQVSRCALYRLEERLHVFAWTYHHVVADSWTLRLLQEQFCAIYRALLEEKPDGSKGTPYAAYVDWIANENRSSTLSCWAAYLERFQSRRVQNRASTVMPGNRNRVHLTLPLELRDSIDDVRRRFKVTTNMVLLAMWGILVLEQQQTSDCLLGCVVFGRNITVRGIETVAGVCANTVPVVIHESRPIRELFTELQQDVLTASARSYLAITDVLASAGLSHRDLHSVVNFTIDERVVRNKHADHLSLEITNVRYTQAANFDAYLDVEAHATGIEITIHFDPARRYFAASEIGRKCEQIVRRFADHPDCTVREILDALLVDVSRFDVQFAFEAPPGGGYGA